MFRQQQQSRHLNQDPPATISATTWGTWLSCICRGRLVVKLILGTTVLLLAVNLWPGPQLLSPDGPESYNQVKPVSGEVNRIGEEQLVSPFAENQLVSPPTESQNTRSNEGKVGKSSSTEDNKQPVKSFNPEVIDLQSVKDSLKHFNYVDGDTYSYIKQFKKENREDNDIAHVTVPVTKQRLIDIYPKASIFSRPTPIVVTNPAVVFLYSSSTRSGSTVFSEMVATGNNSILLYEPFKPFLPNKCDRNSSCVTEILRTSLNCNFKTTKLKMQFKRFFIRTSHQEVERCKGKNRQVVQHCLRRLDIVKLCKETPIRIIKIVRGKLSDLEVFLNEPNIEAKIIHLTRDPRGTIQSVKTLGWLGNATLSSKCKHLYNDLMVFDELHKKYTDRVAKFSIEDFSIDPKRIAEEVFRFLYNEKYLSYKTEGFIATHMSGLTNPGAYNTHKDSQQEYQSWRKEIEKKLLQKVEYEESCQQAIAKMGHNLFGDIENARNLTYSLFDDSYLYT